jgi:hypothetical protein
VTTVFSETRCADDAREMVNEWCNDAWSRTTVVALGETTLNTGLGSYTGDDAFFRSCVITYEALGTGSSFWVLSRPSTSKGRKARVMVSALLTQWSPQRERVSAGFGRKSWI